MSDVAGAKRFVAGVAGVLVVFIFEADDEHAATSTLLGRHAGLKIAVIIIKS